MSDAKPTASVPAGPTVNLAFESVKQLMTLATGILAATVVFSPDLISSGGWISAVNAALVISGWSALLTSALYGLNAMEKLSMLPATSGDALVKFLMDLPIHRPLQRQKRWFRVGLSLVLAGALIATGSRWLQMSVDEASKTASTSRCECHINVGPASNASPSALRPQ